MEWIKIDGSTPKLLTLLFLACGSTGPTIASSSSSPSASAPSGIEDRLACCCLLFTSTSSPGACWEVPPFTAASSSAMIFATKLLCEVLVFTTIYVLKDDRTARLLQNIMMLLSCPSGNAVPNIRHRFGKVQCIYERHYLYACLISTLAVEGNPASYRR